jgi:type I restriction enzyme, S subunit
MPENWETRTLGEIANIRGETVHPRDAIGLKYVGLEHISSGAVQIDCWGDPTKVKSTKNRFYPNDILYGKLRPYLDKVVLAKDWGIASTDILVITSNKADPSFLVHLLHTHRFFNYAKSTMSGVNHPRTSWSALSKFQFECPPLQEQCAIAQAGGAVQEAKAARQREIELERERKAALMQKLFRCGTREQATKHTEIGIMPDNWKVSLLEDVFTLTKKPKNLSYSDFQHVAFVPMNLVPIGHIFFQEYLLKKPDELTSGTYFEPGDLLVAKITPSFENGKQGIIKELPTPFGIATTEVIPIKGVPGTSDVMFLFYYLLLEYVRSALAGKMEGTTGRQRLNKVSVETMHLPLPPLDEQQEIIQILQACDNRITALENENKFLNELFCAMLEEMMAGYLSATPLIQVATHE